MMNLSKHALLLALAAIASPALSGNLDAPGAPAAGSGMPSTADIYNRLDSGAAIAVPGAFQEPLSGPASSGRTLADIRAKLPTPDNANGATASEVAAGKTFWGLRTDGTWGLRSGAMAAGGNVTGGNGVLTLSIPDGFYAGRIATASDSNLVAGNIKSGATIFGVAGTAAVASGNAAAAEVLAGKTFSNGSATGIAGTMPNNGALSITPGTAVQAIPAGYHNGSGSVAGDANLIAGNIRSGATIFGVSGSANVVDASHVSRTLCAQGWGGANCDVCAGQWSGASCNVCPAGWSGVNCDIISKPFTGGMVPTYSSTPWKCVLDSATGLTWEVKTADGGLHDWHNTYTWYDSGADVVGHGRATAGSCIGSPGCDTARYVAAVNAEQLCGYTDWRLPSISELQGLIVPASYPTIDTAYFPNTRFSIYWSGSSYATNPIFVWGVNFGAGQTLADGKNDSVNYVRLVRDGQ